MGGRNNRRSSNSRNHGSNSGGGSSSGRGGRRRGGCNNVYSAIKEGLFVEGGVLSDWQLNTPSPMPSRGRNRNSSGSKGLSFEVRGSGSDIAWRKTSAGINRNVNSLKFRSMNGDGASGSKLVRKKANGRGYGYQYPPIEIQEGLLQEPSAEVNADNDVVESQSFVLCSSKESQIIAYMDDMPPSIPPVASVTYDCSSNFVLGDSSHRGLGFEECEATAAVCETSSKQMEHVAEAEIDWSSSDHLNDKHEGFNGGSELKMEDSLPEKFSSKKNSAFVSIGGIKLYTEDITDDEDDDEECSNEESIESESFEGGGSIQSSESDDSEDIFDGSSSIDDDVAADYLEGVGGSDTLLDAANRLAEEIFDNTDDSSSDDVTETMEKLGGIALQEASREYGMQKNFQSGHKSLVFARDSWSSAMDAFIEIKDPRGLTSKRNHRSQFPQSWPSKSQKNKGQKNYPGAKKKLRKEAIAAKRRDRMMQRGVDLQKINMKLEQIVLDGLDIYSFQPMQSRDCSQVQRLAAIYRLRSSSQGSGKKRFVTVVRTQHTSMPSWTDKVRLEKLIGPGDDADYPVVDVMHTKSASGGGRQIKRNPKGSSLSPQASAPTSRRKSSKNSANQSSSETSSARGKKKGPLANQPVSFISSGVMQSETTEVTPSVIRQGKNVETEERTSVHSLEKFAAFEVHTKGFGSKMMAKMGFVEGQGLGRDGGGRAAPVQVIQRPKSLGLGMNF